MQIRTINLTTEYTFKIGNLNKIEIQQEDILKGMRPIDKNKKLTMEELEAFNSIGFIMFTPTEKEKLDAKMILWELSKLRPLVDRIIELGNDLMTIYVKEKPFKLFNKIRGSSSIDYAKMDQLDNQITLNKKEISRVTELPSIDDFIKKYLIEELTTSSTKY